MRPLLSISILVLALPLLLSCDTEESYLSYERDEAWKQLGLSEEEEAFDKQLAGLTDVKIDPKPVVGENYTPTFPDPITFNPDEWLTNEHVPGVANPDAPKGGELKLSMQGWVATIRSEGPQSRLATLSYMHNLIYQTLLSYEDKLNDYVPRLATHWQIGDDKKTFRFRLNKNARWADGREVTADDVVATIEHLQASDRKDPNSSVYWQELVEYVKSLDRHTVEIRTNKAEWRSFLSIAAGQNIYPAAYIRMDGETYLSDWNWKLPPGTGPYEIKPEDLRKEESITLSRRTDFWAEDDPLMKHTVKGMYNFDRISFIVVEDPELLYQKFLASEIDIFLVSRAQRWVDEINQRNEVQKGWVQKRRIFNYDPDGFSGYVINMRVPPFEKLKVRQALAHLFNREKLFDKFLFYQYEYVKSYFPGQPYARDGASRVVYDPEKARQLLAEAGFKDRDGQGYLLDENGVRFPSLTIEYASPGFTRLHAVFKDALWDEAGIELTLALVDSASLSKRLWDHQFQLYFISWTANRFPDHESFWHSKYADQKQTLNFNGFKNEELDKILEDYKEEFDSAKRTQMLKRVDEIVFNAHPYVLAWYAPYFRILYWDKFGHPKEYASKFDPNIVNLMTYWWYEEEREKRTLQNRSLNRSNYPDKEMSQYDHIEQDGWLSGKWED